MVEQGPVFSRPWKNSAALAQRARTMTTAPPDGPNPQETCQEGWIGHVSTKSRSFLVTSVMSDAKHRAQIS